jgi:hypothetical protein
VIEYQYHKRERPQGEGHTKENIPFWAVRKRERAQGEGRVREKRLGWTSCEEEEWCDF